MTEPQPTLHSIELSELQPTPTLPYQGGRTWGRFESGA